MTLHEKVVLSAYTGILMCDMSEVHRYIEKTPRQAGLDA